MCEAEPVSGTILLVSGPNLNLLGEREPEIYGTTTLADLVAIATEAAATRGHEVEHVQSNHEGDKVELHISNPQAREHWRHDSVIAPSMTASMAGFGAVGYRLAVEGAIAK